MDSLIDKTIITFPIDSHADWLRWCKGWENRTYILPHNKSDWHVSRGPHSRFTQCRIMTRIRSRLRRWGEAECITYHDNLNQLWVTLRLPPRYCRVCNKLIKIDRQECLSCMYKRLYSQRPFYDDYTVREISVLTCDFEYAYRMVKELAKKEKLLVHHLDCSTPYKCHHFKSMLEREKQRGVISNIRMRIATQTLQIVRI